MARKTLGAWLHHALGGRGAAGAVPRVGNSVITNEGAVLGTIAAIWSGSAATDGASHEETLGVRRSEQDETDLLYIPSSAIARVSEQGVVLTVDGTQVVARGWRHRPAWLPQGESARTD